MKFGKCKKCGKKGVQPNRVPISRGGVEGADKVPFYCKYCGTSHTKLST